MRNQKPEIKFGKVIQPQATVESRQSKVKRFLEFWTVDCRLVLGGFLLLLPALSWIPSAMAAQVTATWSYDFSTDPACSATLTTQCVDHFEVLDMTTTRALIQSVTTPPNPTGVVNGIEATFRLGAPYSARTIAVVAVAKDGSGNRVESDPAKAQVVIAIPPGAPLTFVISSR